MKLCDHENVLTCYCCFNVGCSLWIVTPLMIKGSFLRILQYLSSQKRIQDGQGFEECIVAYIIRETAKALKYLHDSNLLHRYSSLFFDSHRRDVKAGNILVDADANIRLADLGVARVLEGTVKKQEARTFVGTPCWMAPEVMNRERYNSRVPFSPSCSPPGGHLVAGHHGAGAVQRVPAPGEVRADGDPDPHGAGRVTVVRVLQRFLPDQAVLGVRGVHQLGAEEGPCAAVQRR